jgi:hypothetical protein
VAKRRASGPIATGRRRSDCGPRTRRLTSHAPDGAYGFASVAGDALSLDGGTTEAVWS